LAVPVHRAVEKTAANLPMRLHVLHFENHSGEYKGAARHQIAFFVVE